MSDFPDVASAALSPNHPPAIPPIALPTINPNGGNGINAVPIAPPSKLPAKLPPAPAAAFPTLSPSLSPVAKSSPAKTAFAIPIDLKPLNLSFDPKAVGFFGFPAGGFGLPTSPPPGKKLLTKLAASNAPDARFLIRFPAEPKLDVIFIFAN
jgi:hypothetical protein